MKCENCGKNEVTFVYRSNINGRITEKHLCSECAETMGFALATHNQRMMRGFDSMFNGGFFDNFFSPRLFERMSGMLEDPFDDFFADMPALGLAPAQQDEQQEKKNDLVSQEEQSHFSKQRQMNALQLELKKAIHREEFERAAELRDQIRALNTESKEEKKND